MSPLERRRPAELIRSAIEREGSISFERFMEFALYAPETGYYTRGVDPFGKTGDYYTAEQLQPVFGTLIAQFIRSVRDQIAAPWGFRVVELGAGRGDMERALGEFGYVGVDVARGAIPQKVAGVIFANEFFDALPVQLVVRRADGFVERRVALVNGKFTFMDGERIADRTLDYIGRWYADARVGSVIEVNLRALDWLDLIAARLERGYVLIIDYGYTGREWIRYQHGTLMSYRRHAASDDVLADPGERDITTHAPFTVLEEYAADIGLTKRRFDTLARFLLDIGERDQFAAALDAASEAERLHRRLQLKTLLFEMGETFRVLLLEKGVPK
jgi:SAM-dependent MidA family methyltransferase